MPTMATAADLPRAIAAILERIAAGDLSPDEGAAVCSVVEAMHRALELTAIDSRLRAGEERTKG